MLCWFSYISTSNFFCTSWITQTQKKVVHYDGTLGMLIRVTHINIKDVTALELLILFWFSRFVVYTTYMSNSKLGKSWKNFWFFFIIVVVWMNIERLWCIRQYFTMVHSWYGYSIHIFTFESNNVNFIGNTTLISTTNNYNIFFLSNPLNCFSLGFFCLQPAKRYELENVFALILLLSERFSKFKEVIAVP